MTTRIIIARHGNNFTKEQTPLRVGARTDLPLVETERGTNIGKYLKMRTLIPAVVFAAPLKRTTETARLAIAALDKDIPLVADSRFTEIDYGPDEGKPETEVVAREGRKLWTPGNARRLFPRAGMFRWTPLSKPGKILQQKLNAIIKTKRLWWSAPTALFALRRI